MAQMGPALDWLATARLRLAPSGGRGRGHTAQRPRLAFSAHIFAERSSELEWGHHDSAWEGLRKAGTWARKLRNAPD